MCEHFGATSAVLNKEWPLHALDAGCFCNKHVKIVMDHDKEIEKFNVSDNILFDARTRAHTHTHTITHTHTRTHTHSITFAEYFCMQTLFNSFGCWHLPLSVLLYLLVLYLLIRGTE